MGRPAHPHAMHPAHPGRTRTAPPQLPDQFPFQGRYRAYTLFDLTGFVYFAMGFVVLHVVRTLAAGSGPWEQLIASFSHPGWVLFHVVALVSVLFVGARFFSLFPKAQPPRIGPLKPPPRPLIWAMLNLVWCAVTVVFLLIAGGALFP